ncbi:MAG: 5-deoxy-glucuronate isomerase [SAR324 cluster bacterium]|nr:5-deoxy-glucuronate isomerase [SAR324 cluster bacterium]
MEHLIRPINNETIKIDVTPESASWDYLSFKVVSLKKGESFRQHSASNEMALVPLSGHGRVQVGGERFDLFRESVFKGRASVLYVPPNHEITVDAEAEFEFALGGAPAEGKYPVRLFEPAEIKTEIRGGGKATRQVVHTLAHPLPAERLILYEIYLPGGSWSGWPPHCHDGYGGSPCLDEVYYFRTDPDYGFGMHRNYRVDSEFDEILPFYDGDLVLVTKGFHSTAAAPNCNVYFLNYLAGNLLNEARATPPFDDPDFAWIKTDWEANEMKLPVLQEKE